MPRREDGRGEDRPTAPRPCCLVSEILEESGLDRERIRLIRRQLLQGMIMLCQWQLERMDEARRAESRADGARPRARQVTIE